ncbi:MAG: hypothetical protein NC397_08395 [Clostridium sp.]|nr:hypothetical protein [Clostridium sp.]
MDAKIKQGLRKYKGIIIFAVVILVILVVFLAVFNHSEDSEEVVMPEECDASYSIITREEAERIALEETERKYEIYFDDYDSVDSTYCVDGCWYVSWGVEPVVCDGGILITVDENTKHVVRVLGGDNIILTEKHE